MTTPLDPAELDAGYTAIRDLDQPIPLTLTSKADEQIVTFAPEDTMKADLPMEALVDVVASAVADVETLIDTLPDRRHDEPTHADTYAWCMARRKAYLDAEAKVSEAWQALKVAQQLVKGLAR